MSDIPDVPDFGDFQPPPTLQAPPILDDRPTSDVDAPPAFRTLSEADVVRIFCFVFFVLFFLFCVLISIHIDSKGSIETNGWR